MANWAKEGNKTSLCENTSDTEESEENTRYFDALNVPCIARILRGFQRAWKY